MTARLSGLLSISLLLCGVVFAQSDLGSQRSFSLAPSGACPVGIIAEVVSTDADNGKKYCCPTGTWTLCPEADTSLEHATELSDESGTNADVFATGATMENLTINLDSGNPTDPVLQCTQEDDLDALLVDYTGRVAINDADLDAALTVRSGIEWSPGDLDNVEMWFRVEDVSAPETCDVTGGGSGNMTADWVSVGGGYTASPASEDGTACDGSAGSHAPSHVCGHCCEWSYCTNILSGCDCDDFTSSKEIGSGIISHVESSTCEVALSDGDYFTISPIYTLDTLNDSFTIVALTKMHTAGWAADKSGYLVSDTRTGKAGSGDTIFVVRDNQSPSPAKWRADASGTSAFTNNLGGTETSGSCVDDLQGEGAGAFGVLTVQVEKTASNTLTMNYARMNGANVMAGAPTMTNSGIEFEVSYILGYGTRTVEFMLFHDTGATMSLANIQLAENYLANKYGLGAGIADNTGALDDDAAGLGSDLDGLIVENTAGENKFRADATGSVFMAEKAAASTSVADFGQLYVKDGSPGTAWFVDEDDTEFQLGVGGGSASGAPNYSQSFSSQTSVTLTHALGTKNILVQCYDSTDIAIGPNDLDIDAADPWNAVVTFAASQTGRCIVNGLMNAGRYTATVTAQTTVTVTGATHGLGTNMLAVTCYDDSDPRARVEPNTVTADDGTNDVVITFFEAETGQCVLQ